MTLPVCRKRRYRDKEEAVSAMHRRLTPPLPGQADGGCTVDKLYVYMCGRCHGWHMTHEAPYHARAAASVS